MPTLPSVPVSGRGVSPGRGPMVMRQPDEKERPEMHPGELASLAPWVTADTPSQGRQDRQTHTGDEALRSDVADYRC